MAASDLPEMAVEDLAQIITHHITGFDLDDIQDERLTDDHRKLAAKCYAAAAPHIRADERAQVLAEVDAALRDEAEGWRKDAGYDEFTRAERAGRYEMAAAFLRLKYDDEKRDTLGAGGEGE